mgnify:FL=1
MNFDLTADQKAAQALARSIAEQELLPGVIERDENGVFPVEIFREKIGKAGFIGLPYPKEYGGQDGDYLSYILAIEEFSKVEAAVGISYSVCTSLFSGGVMLSDASEEIKKKYLPAVLSGQSFASFALTEPDAGSDAAAGKTLAVRDGDVYVINGMKCFITNGPLADVYVVYTLTDPTLGTKGMAAFIVERNTPGLSIGKIENKMGIRAAQVSEIHFKNVRVPIENMIAAPGKGFALAMKSLDGGRIGVAAQGLGIAKGAFEIAKNYLKEREQFGKPLCKQQYLSFKMAELETEIESAQWLLYKAAMDKQEHRPYSQSAARAKLTCTDVAMHVTTECVQMLGGNGYMKEYHLERMMRDAKITQIYEGTNEIQKLVLSGAMFRK